MFLRLLQLSLIIYLVIYLVRFLIPFTRLKNTIIGYWIHRITDPLINFLDTKIPVKFGIYNFSLVLPVLLIWILLKIFSDIQTGVFTFNFIYFLLLFVYLFNSIFKLLWIIIFIIVIIIFLNNEGLIKLNFFIQSILKKIIEPVLIFLKNLLKLNQRNPERVYLIILIIILGLAGLVEHFAVRNLIYFLLNEVTHGK